MIKTLIQIESIEKEKSFDEVKEERISHIEERIIDISFCSRESPHPVHLSKKFLEEVSCGISLYSEKTFWIKIPNRITCIGMYSLRCILEKIILFSYFLEKHLLIVELIPYDLIGEYS